MRWPKLTKRAENGATRNTLLSMAAAAIRRAEAEAEAAVAAASSNEFILRIARLHFPIMIMTIIITYHNSPLGAHKNGETARGPALITDGRFAFGKTINASIRVSLFV